MNLKSDLVYYSRLCYNNRFLSATDGNLSVRIDNKNIYSTPTNLCKGKLKLSDIIKVDIQGNLTEGKRNPSSEFKMHKYIYECRQDVNAVIHTHPVFVSAFACARIPLDKIVFPEVYMKLGIIPLAEYAAPSTDEIPESIAKYVKDYKAVILENHGLVAYGSDLEEAYYITEKVEKAAEVIFYAKLLGGEKELTKSQIKQLDELKKKWKL
jgi:L-fuculose-phosphate aldolase